MRATLDQEAPAAVETVTFYSWMGWDEKNKCNMPSSQVVRISGGQRMKDTTGRAVSIPVKEARFHHGLHTTSDPETITELRRQCAIPGNCITEDREIFYSYTMTSEQRAKRAGTLNSEQKSVIEEQGREINRLKSLLESKSQKKDAAA